MKKYLVAAALIVAFATPALAADYYVALRLGGGAAKCEIMTTEPDTKTYKMMGKYTSEADAKAAMAKMPECK
jgi:opacity protein-like surface antigen